MKHHILLQPLLLVTLAVIGCNQLKGPTGPEGPQGPPGTDGLTDPNVQPKVIWTFPPNESEGPYPGFFTDGISYIRVRFNKIMDINTLIKAVTLSSPTTSARIDTNFIYTLDGSAFFFYVTDTTYPYYYGYRWKVNEQYTLTIDTTAKDINGNTLRPVFNLVFKPEPYFRVLSIYPKDGATNVNIYTSVELRFNSPVRTNIFASILSNLTNGEWRIDPWGYHDSSYVYFYNFSSLQYGTTYSIVVNTNARDRYDNQLGQQFSASFTTAPPPPLQVTYTYPYNGQMFVSRSTSIEVDFNTSLDTSTVRNAFSINPTVAGDIYFPFWSPSYFSFYPSSQLAANQTYAVTIDTTIRSVDGRKLSSPYTFSFTTGQ
jgi:hypothetical protein